MKEQVKEIISRKMAEMLAEVDALQEDAPSSEEVEALRAQLQSAQDENAALKAQLQSVDQLAKQIDAAIPDQAPQA